MAPGVRLNEPKFIWLAAIDGSIENDYFAVTLPLNIILYNTTTNHVFVTTNGVSLLSKTQLDKTIEGEGVIFISLS
jgi:hypothetical protein